MHHHTVFFSTDYPREFANIFGRREFPTEPTVYVSAPSLSDRSLVPGDGEALFVMANAPATGDENWNSRTATVRERMLSVLRRGGLALERENIAVKQVWTPQTFAQRYHMPGGAIYGTHSHGWRNAFLRPPNKDHSISGLYYVGGSTHPGGGTPTVLLSAKITSDLVVRHETS
jgi:phytoene desaturase